MTDFKTHISELDTLLGFDKESSKGNPVEPGSIIILRGGPGSGKTTLGLQILSRFLEEYPASDKGKAKGDENHGRPGCIAVFVSLESKASKAIDRVKSNFGFFKKSDSLPICLSAEDQHSLFGLTTIGTLGRYSIPFLGRVAVIIIGILKALQGDMSVFTKSLDIGILRMLSEITRQVKSTWRTKRRLNILGRSRKSGLSGIIFIDSLNALVSQACRWLGEEGNPEAPRLVVNKLCDSLRKRFKDFVIICSSEFHSLATWHASGMSESFICDAEIVLESEPISVQADYVPNKQGSVGYSIFKTLGPAKDQENSRLETRSFVRVAKLRSGANQSRRCSYNIVDGKGLSFYATYPGDGHILLFNENLPQREAWAKFLNEDTAHLYPSLRYETFDRSSLQNTFSTQRHFKYIPTQTDLYLSSFDNFWISWYGEVNWKWAIASILNAELRERGEKPMDTTASSITVNDIHRAMNKQPEVRNAIARCISRNLKVPGIANKVDAASSIENILTSDPCRRCVKCLISWSFLRAYMKKADGAQRDLTRRCMLLSLAHPTAFRDGSMRGNSKWRDAKATKILSLYVAEADRDKARAICRKISDLLSTGDEKMFTKCRAEEISVIMSGYERQAAAYGRALDDTHRGRKPTDFFDSNYEEIIKKIPGINIEGDLRFDCEWKRRICGYIDPKRDFLEKPDTGFATFLKLLTFRIMKLLAKQLYDEEALGNIEDCLPAVDGQKDELEALIILARVYWGIISQHRSFSLLQEMPEDRIKLFGERRSDIIEELERPSDADNRPIHRPDTLFSIKKRNWFVSIPYDANVGLFVVRKDLLNDLKPVAAGMEYKYYLKEICQFERTAVQAAFGDGKPGYDAGQIDTDVLARKDREFLVTTWEEMIALLYIGSKEFENHNKRGKKKYVFLMETISASSFYSAFLEILWNCGGDLVVDSVYEVENPIEAKQGLFKALLIFGLMLSYEIIPFDATYNLEYFSKKYSREKGRSGGIDDGSPPEEDWVFARHWYSTLIDVLTARRSMAGGRPGTSQESLDFYWRNDDAELELMPFPVSMEYYLREKGNPKRISCWGDWHLGVSSGSENVGLGIDLVNNMMSSQRVCERAESGACLPTVRDFYDLYGSNRCVKAFGRPEKMIPATTYKQLRDRYFMHAKSRTQIFDYQHCIQEIDALLKFVYSQRNMFRVDSASASSDFFRKDLPKEIDNAIERIKNFKNKPMQFNSI